MSQREFTPEQIEFIRKVTELCSRNYQRGGDTVIECFSNAEIVDTFKTLDDVRKYCGIKVEQALNHRWGEDSDPEVSLAERYRDWEN